jgi:hypothetical protein
MQVSLEEFREALDVIGDDAGDEAAIVAQFALDVAVTAKFRANAIEPARARQLLRLRIAHHRAAQRISTNLAQSPRQQSSQKGFLLIQGGRQ